MATDDAATGVATAEHMAGLDGELSEPLGDGDDRFGATVVAGPPDDALASARRELLGAVFGGMSSGLL